VATVSGLNVERITADHEQSSDDRLVFVLGVCPECGGSGEYVGLNAVETCGGSGRV
jgi:DnaJ-class molecular chaperone